MSAYKLNFVNFCNLYFPLTYNPEIATQPSMSEPDSHLTEFSYGFVFIIYIVKKSCKRI